MCEPRDELQARLKAAFEQWYSFKDVPGKNRETKDAEKKGSPHSAFPGRSRCQTRVQQRLATP
jgi:hypothetical protein